MSALRQGKWSIQAGSTIFWLSYFLMLILGDPGMSSIRTVLAIVFNGTWLSWLGCGCKELSDRPILSAKHMYLLIGDIKITMLIHPVVGIYG